MTGGWALAEAARSRGGLRGARDGIAAMAALGSEDFKTYFLGLLAAILAKDGETGAALDVIAEALSPWSGPGSASTRRSFFGRRAS